MAETDHFSIMNVVIAVNNLATKLMEFTISPVLRAFIAIGTSILLSKSNDTLHNKLPSQHPMRSY